jgi:hypothetical protein
MGGRPFLDICLQDCPARDPGALFLAGFARDQAEAYAACNALAALRTIGDISLKWRTELP